MRLLRAALLCAAALATFLIIGIVIGTVYKSFNLKPITVTGLDEFMLNNSVTPKRTSNVSQGFTQQSGTVLVNRRVPKPQNNSNFRLPKNVVPIRYMIDLNVSMDALEYNGTVVIECQALIKTNQITVHESVTQIQWIKVTDAEEGYEYPVFGFTQENHNFLTISLNQTILEDHKFLLTIGFYNRVPYARNGGFPGVFFDKSEDGQPLMVTGFEQNFARTAFPCFDEPHLKATFAMRISVEEEFDVFFNMPEDKETSAWWSRHLLSNGPNNDKTRKTSSRRPQKCPLIWSLL
ncbi:hypothetical protein L596_029975 [Steinernema carpocapsae]|uniref:Aminopeptidase N-like N-terminal domain-containing protein n=1 Tax=Steinernema carpocapsae TaxID=34508 RepID=A0A4U5LRD3_STECR|nr:hypothetical protein L596_029975 [Steinernema carpocapsae]